LAENVYEGMFMLDANRYGRDPESVSGQIPKMIEKAGGRLLVSRLWEERRLAYPIRGHRKAAYWLTYFRLEGRELAGLERKCRLSDSVLRVLFLKVDPRIVDTLVEHAQGGATGPPRQATAPTTASKPGADDDKTAAPKSDKSASDKTASDKTASDKTASDKAASDKSESDKAESDKTATVQPETPSAQQ